MYLFGASGHGKVIKEIIEAEGLTVETFVDDNKEINECADRPVLHKDTGLSPMIVSVGVNRIRKMIVKRLQTNNESIEFATAIHPSAIVSPSAKIGVGTAVMAGAIINADAIIGKHCIINTGASIDHECVIGDYCHVAPHATLCGQVHLGEGTIMGVGSCAIPCVKIGSWCTIGAGAAVVNDIADGVTAVGVPAKSTNKVNNNYLQDAESSVI